MSGSSDDEGVRTRAAESGSIGDVRVEAVRVAPTWMTVHRRQDTIGHIEGALRQQIGLYVQQIAIRLGTSVRERQAIEDGMAVQCESLFILDRS